LGLNVNYATHHSNWTPLMSAVSNGHFEIAHLLLANGADKTIQTKNYRTVLDMAKYRDRTEIITLLE
jgi:ankyrin repeat protein